ncbi:hypothetical protein B0H19DRAFT_1067120 [Mycena capillaripes]|nr:hypothetical protein B0H19DRAFT_1067120 [Mycena capillaripes]
MYTTPQIKTRTLPKSHLPNKTVERGMAEKARSRLFEQSFFPTCPIVEVYLVQIRIQLKTESQIEPGPREKMSFLAELNVEPRLNVWEPPMRQCPEKTGEAFRELGRLQIRSEDSGRPLIEPLGWRCEFAPMNMPQVQAQLTVYYSENPPGLVTLAIYLKDTPQCSPALRCLVSTRHSSDANSALAGKRTVGDWSPNRL